MVTMHDADNCFGRVDKMGYCNGCAKRPLLKDIRVVGDADFNNVHELSGDEPVCAAGVIAHIGGARVTDKFDDVTCAKCREAYGSWRKPTAVDPRGPGTVDHPAHYGGEKNPYETIKVIEAWKLGFCLGNAIKYISRADHKGHSIEDLEKAIWYIRREIAARKGDL